MFMAPGSGFDRCDCRIQVLEAIRLEIQTWTIGTVPNLDEWVRGCAGWIVELPTEDLRTFWPGMLGMAVACATGLPVRGATAMIQQQVVLALLTKEATA